MLLSSHSVKLQIYIKITPAQQESGVCTCVAFVFKDSLLSSVLQERVSPKSLIGLEFRSSGVGSWLVLQNFGLVVVGKRNLAHELNGKKIN